MAERHPAQQKVGKAVALRIQRFRTEEDISVELLAEMMEVSPATIRNWERNKNLPQRSNLEQLAKEMGITMDELMDTSIVPKEDQDGQWYFEGIAEHQNGRRMTIDIPVKQGAKEAQKDLNRMVPDAWWDNMRLFKVELTKKKRD